MNYICFQPGLGFVLYWPQYTHDGVCQNSLSESGDPGVRKQQHQAPSSPELKDCDSFLDAKSKSEPRDQWSAKILAQSLCPIFTDPNKESSERKNDALSIESIERWVAAFQPPVGLVVEFREFLTCFFKHTRSLNAHKQKVAYWLFFFLSRRVTEQEMREKNQYTSKEWSKILSSASRIIREELYVSQNQTMDAASFKNSLHYLWILQAIVGDRMERISLFYLDRIGGIDPLKERLLHRYFTNKYAEELKNLQTVSAKALSNPAKTIEDLFFPLSFDQSLRGDAFIKRVKMEFCKEILDKALLNRGSQFLEADLGGVILGLISAGETLIPKGLRSILLCEMV
jgi:hypothetical protein